MYVKAYAYSMYICIQELTSKVNNIIINNIIIILYYINHII